MAFTLHTLPIHIIYLILDNLDNETLFLSTQYICQNVSEQQLIHIIYQTFPNILNRLHLSLVFKFKKYLPDNVVISNFQYWNCDKQYLLY